MSSGLTDEDKRRIESFCETPPYDRSPEDLTSEQQYTDDVRMPEGESERSLLSAFLNRLRNR